MNLLDEYGEFEGTAEKSCCYDINFRTGYGYEDEEVLLRVRDDPEPNDWDDLGRRMINSQERAYFELVFKLCGLIQKNSEYVDKEWALTEYGLHVTPVTIIYDKVANRLCASIDMFDIFEHDGHISWQVKCYREAFKEIKKICKQYKLLWPGIKVGLKLDIEGLDAKISKNDRYDKNNKYSVKNFTNRVLRLWVDIDLNKLTDVQCGTIRLFGNVVNLYGRNNTFDSLSSLWVKE